MIEPIQRDGAFLADVARRRSERDQFSLWWLGQSGFLVQWRGQHLLLDPYLSDSLTTKYAQTDKPHVRLTARVVAPEQLDFIDVVTSSHNHTDHLDAETLIPLRSANPQMQMVVPEANLEFASERLKAGPGALLGIQVGQTLSIKDFRLTAVPAAHEKLEIDEQGRHRYVGYIVELGPWTVYHSGDTVRYPGMVELLSQWHVDVMLLPINGADPARRVAGNLNGPEAATLAKQAGARLAVPCHFEMFEFNTAAPDAFVQTAADLHQPVRVLRAGEGWSSAELGC